MTDLPDWSQPAPMVVTARFVVPLATAEEFVRELRDVVDLVGGMPGCVSIGLGRATDDPTLWSLTSLWEAVGDYRRALSSFEVKVRAVPLLSQAIDEPAAFEILYGRRGAVVHSASSARAMDADTAGPGDRLAPGAPR